MRNIEKIKTKIRQLHGKNFISSMLNLCEELQSDYNVLIFSFIIFDDTTPEIRKILKDTYWWKALDLASGDRMMVFAMSDEIETKSNNSYSNTMHLMTNFNQSRPSKTKSYSHILKKIFDNETMLTYPSVLFFQVYDNEIYNYRLVPLKRGGVTDSALSIQKLFESISKVLNKIELENIHNYKEIYNLVEDELIDQNYRIFLLNGPWKLATFIEIVRKMLL